MFKILVHTGCYIIDIGFCDFLRQFANIKPFVFESSEIDFFRFDFLLTSQNNFDKLYKDFDFFANKTVIYDSSQNNLLELNSKEIKLFFENFFLKKYIELENNEITEREKEIIKFVALGYTNKSIADELNISIHTVITHRKNISSKLNIKSIAGLTVYAIMNGIVELDQINF